MKSKDAPLYSPFGGPDANFRRYFSIPCVEAGASHLVRLSDPEATRKSCRAYWDKPQADTTVRERNNAEVALVPGEVRREAALSRSERLWPWLAAEARRPGALEILSLETR